LYIIKTLSSIRLQRFSLSLSNHKIKPFGIHYLLLLFKPAAAHSHVSYLRFSIVKGKITTLWFFNSNWQFVDVDTKRKWFYSN